MPYGHKVVNFRYEEGKTSALEVSTRYIVKDSSVWWRDLWSLESSLNVLQGALNQLGRSILAMEEVFPFEMMFGSEVINLNRIFSSSYIRRLGCYGCWLGNLGGWLVEVTILEKTFHCVGRLYGCLIYDPPKHCKSEIRPRRCLDL